MDTTVIFIILGVIAFIAIVFVGWYISTSNRFNVMGVKVEESESGIDVALTKRFDLLNKLFQVAKGFAQHERETLESVVAMRNPGAGAPIAEKMEFNNKMTEAMKSLNLVVERYPELKANENFVTLSHATIEVEEQLQAARRLYNSNISIFNQSVVTFPSSFVANRKGLTKKEFFQAEETKRADVEFKF